MLEAIDFHKSLDLAWYQFGMLIIDMSIDFVERCFSMFQKAHVLKNSYSSNLKIIDYNIL